MEEEEEKQENQKINKGSCIYFFKNGVNQGKAF